MKNGERFFFFAETGHLVIGKLSPNGFEEIDRAKVLEPTQLAFGRDVVWSLYNHHSHFKAETYDLFNGTPGLVGEPLPRPDPDILSYFHTWLERDGYPLELKQEF